MITADSSVVIAAFASWHEAHEGARAAVDEGPRLPGHVMIEVYSVLTRLPPPHRAEPLLVAEYLQRHFAGPPLMLPAHAQQRLIRRAPTLGISGGAIYDALIAATADHAGVMLLTRDARAVAVYEGLGVGFKVLP